MGNYSGRINKSSVLTSRNSIGTLNSGMRTNKIDQQPEILENKMSGIKWSSIVTLVLVEAKSLQPIPEDGVKHNLFCKFSLGSESYKTKAVASTVQPEWRERFKLCLQKDNFLKISIWDKGKQKNFMGSCILDLSVLERERTHDIWEQLDDGYGLIHLSITICLSSPNNSSSVQWFNLEDSEQRHNIYDFRSNWQLVGLLYVNILGAKGLVGKPNAYCILELDNERVQTPIQKASSKPTWNKYYVLNVYDVTSTLDLKVYNSALLNEPLGKVSIPLLMIANGEKRWYALKDRNKGYLAKGNYPRVRLQMTIIWSPIKASLRLFRPKPVKYVTKPKKYDVALMYSNIEFIGKLFKFLYEVNEGFKRLFEWDDRESSFIALIGWLVFCFYFRLWAVPLLLLLPFIYHWSFYRYQNDKYHVVRTSNPSDSVTKNNTKVDKSYIGKLHDLQHTMLLVTNGIEYLASMAEKSNNLISFKVPFLSYLSMILLIIVFLVLYFIPFNYLLMGLGVYKYTRKYLNPDRVPNNDLLDFLSRIPDYEVLKDWKELSVPEPAQK